MVFELQLRITGRVQGVGFRMYIQEQALALQLNGKVSNMADGSVAVTAQGAKEDLQRLMHYARLGPAYAEVDMVQATWREPQVIRSGFRAR